MSLEDNRAACCFGRFVDSDYTKLVFLFMLCYINVYRNNWILNYLICVCDLLFGYNSCRKKWSCSTKRPNIAFVKQHLSAHTTQVVDALNKCLPFPSLARPLSNKPKIFDFKTLIPFFYLFL
ncbi:hypothetical protein L6452_16511 [Arctium lappa]|uniref:Uncharacterized protein n=1 Tax=Arctium lappa TaxID=4217 RepID=A0ACB9C0T3_ARCLA|nr:hypothetical protein L6452_16511 [Arctium lappa]